MACLDNIIEINKSDCIGNSRETINTNFTILKDKVCSLNTQTEIIEEKSIYYVPLYGIIMYYGDITPGGTDFEPNGIGKVSKNLQAFAVCNGANGTPDMQDRFVVGAGRSYAQKTFGPQVAGQQPSTTNDTLSLQFSSVRLDVTEMPTHNHDYTEPNNGTGHSHTYLEPNNGTGHNHTGTASSTGSEHKHDISKPITNDESVATCGLKEGDSGSGADCGVWSTDTGGAHTHTLSIQNNTTGISINRQTTGITISDKGDSQKHENRPPYIALGYIMRIL